MYSEPKAQCLPECYKVATSRGIGIITLLITLTAEGRNETKISDRGKTASGGHAKAHSPTDKDLEIGRRVDLSGRSTILVKGSLKWRGIGACAMHIPARFSQRRSASPHQVILVDRIFLCLLQPPKDDYKTSQKYGTSHTNYYTYNDILLSLGDAAWAAAFVSAG